MSVSLLRPFHRSALLLCLAASLWAPSSRAQTNPPAVDAGSLTAAFDVDSIGGATYTINLNLPPGTSGLAPDLGVVYNNQAPDGVLGLGFTLTGLSSITRCAATEPLDGYIGTVSYDRQDRFCLDNSRLILVSGGEYGADGTVYHTEKETWTEVVAQAACGSGPCSFIARNKDGWRLEFASVENARLTVPNQPEVIAWQIYRIIDLNNNYVEVEYGADETTLQNNPSLIRYTGNLSTGLAPQRSVSFDYEDRPDDVQKYQGGIRFIGNKRLASIRSGVSGQPVTTYRFEYQQSESSGRSLLTSIQACATQSGQCLSPTTFNWQTTSSAVRSPNNSSDGRIIDGWCQGSSAQLTFGDFNGDGRADLLCVLDSLPYVLLSTGSGVESPNNSADGRLTVPDSWCQGSDAVMSWADFNADQLIDLVCAADASSFAVLVSDGSNLKSPNNQASGTLDVPGDWCPLNGQCRAGWLNFDGDGSADLACNCTDGQQRVLISNGSNVISPNSSATGTVASGYCSDSGAQTFWSDFNGDGMSDLFCRDAGTQSVLVSTGESLESPNNDAQGIVITGWCGDSDSALNTADFNGDGMQDLSCHGADGTQQVMLSTQQSLASPNNQADGTLRSGWCAGDPSQADWGDFNGDGLSDLFCHSGDGLQSVLISDGAAVTSPVSNAEGTIATNWCDSQNANGSTHDFNGDALADLSCFDSDSGSAWVLLHDAPFPDLLTGIENGLGGGYAIAYLPMTDDEVYSRGSAAQFPVLDVQTPMYVVKEYTQSDGQGGEYSFAYHYTGARTHLELRQWLGFESVKRTTLADGRYSITEYTQDYPVTQFIKRAVTYSASGVMLVSADYTPWVSNPYTNVYQVLRATEVSSTYTAGQADYVFEKDYEYDEYGNPSLISDLGDVTDPDENVFDCWKYINRTTEGQWIIGYEREHKTARTAQACRDFLAAESSAWDPATDLRWDTTGYDQGMNPTDLSAYDDVNAVWLTQSSSYDEYGNAITMTDWAGNTTQLEYDATYWTFPVKIRSPQLEGGITLELNFAYDAAFGVLTSETDPNGNQRLSVLDDFGRIVEEWGPDPSADTGQATVQLALTIYDSDPSGNYVEIGERQDWENGDTSSWPWSRIYVDGLARPVKTIKSGPAGGDSVISQQLYNALQLPSKTALPRFVDDEAEWVETLYDDFDRPIRVIQPDDTEQTFEYLQGELLVRSVMAAGTADARESVNASSVREALTETTASNQATVQYEYDPLVQVTRVIGANSDETTFTYDSLGRIVSSLSSDSGSKTFVYNDRGQLASVTDGDDNVTTFSYDAISRVSSKTIRHAEDSPSVYLFHYDEPQYANSLGNLTRVEEPESSYEFSYSRYSLVATERLDFQGQSWLQRSDYSPTGDVTRLVYPDGAVLTTSYDGQGNIQRLQIQADNDDDPETVAEYTSYNALNQVTAVQYGNGLSTSYSYYPYQAAMMRLESILTTAPDASTALYRAEYVWNKVGQVAARQEKRGDGLESEFTFDYNQMGWLVRSGGPYGTFDYDYDAGGNITLKDGVSYTYKSNTNQLISGSNELSAAYDGNGNVTALEWPGIRWDYSYDANANLARISKDGNVVDQALYDYAGRRISRVDEDGNQSIYISGDYDAYFGHGQQLYTKYVNGPNGRIAAITTEATEAEKVRLSYQAALMASGLYDTSTAKGAWLSALQHLKAFSISVRSRIHAWLLLLLASLTALLWVRRRTCQGGPEGAIRSLLSWLLAFALLATSIPVPARAELSPGQGYPKPGILFFQGDLTQNNLLVTDESGQPTSVVAYLPYGRIDQERSDGPDDFRPKFGGKEYDFGSQLYYFDARYFNPELGRFMQPDPQTQYSSPYVYVGNDPLSLMDPDGEVATAVVVGAMAAVGVVAGAYAGGSAVNREMNPAHWDWESGNSVAPIFAGALIGAAGGAIGGALAAKAGVTANILGEVFIGLGEGAAFAAMGGGSPKEIAVSALSSAAGGGFFAAGGAAAGRMASGSRFAQRGAASLAEEAGTAGRAAGRAGAASDLGAYSMGVESRALRQAESGAVSRRSLNSSDYEDFGGCTGFSFTSDTQVATPDGPVLIFDIQPGDRVLGMRDDGSTGSFTVLAAYKRLSDATVLVSTGPIRTETTAEHPFWVEKKGWTAAKDLSTGDHLLNHDGQSIRVTGISVSNEPAWVFNFEVAESHNYFAGDDQLLVHNPKRCRAFTGKTTVRRKGGVPNTRLTAMGNTPGKNSRVGRAVFQDMKQRGLIRCPRRGCQVKVVVKKGSSRVWKDLDEKIHMGHIDDAVAWWNRTGYQFGARSREVRDFMLDPTNYEFEWGSLNSGNGGSLGHSQQYRKPAGWPGQWPP